MEEHERYMKMAISLARKNIENGHGGPFGAIVVKNGEIIAGSENRVIKNNDPTAHAEILAIREACRKLQSHQLNDCVIYSSCEPCPMCMGAIYWARPAMLVYAGTKNDAAKAGFDDKIIYEQIQLPALKRSIPATQIMEDEARKVFELFTVKNNKIIY